MRRQKPSSPHPTPAPELQLDLFRGGLKRLRQLLDGPWPPLRDGVLAEPTSFELALDAVEVAEEELALQTEELVTAREALERERSRFVNLFEFAPDGYLVTDASGVILKYNRSAICLLNTSGRALQGKPLAVFFDERERVEFRQTLARLGAGRQVTDWEVTLKRQGCPPLPAQVNAVLLPRVGDHTHDELLWAVRDLSARRAAEQALHDTEDQLRHAQRLEAVGRLAGGVAHSFNNLLAAMAFHGELLGAGIGDAPRLQVHIDEIQQAIERGGALASQLLAFSRKQHTAPRVLDVNGVLGGMQPVLERLAGPTIQLATHLDPAAGAVQIDPAQLEQVVLNLVVNARDAMPGGGRLRVETAGLELAGDEPVALPAGFWAQLTFTDSGTGMTEEVRQRLFEPFFTTKEPYHGTGLGLSTVYGIVRQAGGEIRVESRLGEGTRFQIWLPRIGRPDRPAAVPAAAPPPADSKRGSEILLLVEDEDNIREPAIEILTGQGYTVLGARNGSEALAIAREQPGRLDLLVTDILMPGMDGRQLASELARLRPDLKVLLISGHHVPNSELPDAHWPLLHKPFPPRVLLNAIRGVLDGDSEVRS